MKLCRLNQAWWYFNKQKQKAYGTWGANGLGIIREAALCRGFLGQRSRQTGRVREKLDGDRWAKNRLD